jgi:hypothetical protein
MTATFPFQVTIVVFGIHRIARCFAEEQTAVLAALRSERNRIRFQRLCAIPEEKPGKRCTL